MGWFRARGRRAAALALFALAVQLFASLGHVHAPALKHAALGAIGSASSSADAGHSDDHDEDGDRPCGVCIALHLLGVAQISAPPQLLLPAAFAAAVDVPMPAIVAALPCASFRSRAPPSV